MAGIFVIFSFFSFLKFKFDFRTSALYYFVKIFGTTFVMYQSSLFFTNLNVLLWFAQNIFILLNQRFLSF
jgi:hypothetical protein